MEADIEDLKDIATGLDWFSANPLARNLRIAIAEIEAHRAQNVGTNEGWQPIETAPHGVPILCAVHLGQAFVLLKNNFGEFVHYPRSWDAARREYVICNSPTHWRPLPDAPKCGAERGVNPPTADNLEAPQ